jgi:predicted Rossmann-fold nucleotide-binding protein
VTADLARVLAAEGLGLVYGGAGVGLMATLADTVLDEGGEVIGVIPRALVEKEIAHNGVSDLRVVDSMHERKALMAITPAWPTSWRMPSRSASYARSTGRC